MTRPTGDWVPIVRRDDLTTDSDPAHDFDGPDPFAPVWTRDDVTELNRKLNRIAELLERIAGIRR